MLESDAALGKAFKSKAVPFYMNQADLQAFCLIDAYGQLEAMVQAGKYRKVKTRKNWICKLCDSAFDAGSESYDVSTRMFGRVKVCLSCIQEQNSPGSTD